MKAIKELTKQELRDLLDKNKEFESYVWERAYQSNMVWQEERSKELLGEADGIKINNHYNSFFFSLSDARAFFGTIVEGNIYYDEQKALYKQAEKMLAEYDNMTADETDERGDEVWGEFEETCEKLMKLIEAELLDFENVSDGDIENEMEYLLDECEFETDGEKVYETITKVYR